MPWSHHSHSGQFCGHAANTLEEVVQDAIGKGMTTFCLTEHIGRAEEDFYPEEANHHTAQSLAQLYDDSHAEARRLQQKYAGQIELFVGFEGEWIREGSLAIIEGLLAKQSQTSTEVSGQSVCSLQTSELGRMLSLSECFIRKAG